MAASDREAARMHTPDDNVAEEWVTVRTCTWGHEADFLRSVLEGSDIEAFIPDEQMSTLRPHLLLGTGGVRLQVRAGDAERAREVLAAVEE
jgi:hypothetical protein